MSLIGRIRRDIRNNPNVKGRVIVVSYSVINAVRKKAKNKWILLLCSPLIVFYKLITDLILGCEIPASTEIGEGLIIHHGRAIVLNKNVKIGNNVTIKHNTTIGNKEDLSGNDLGSPIIGNNVLISPHVIILGPITIGDNSVIGAGSVVIKDVPPNTIVAGNPAKIIKTIQV